jgi:hypothetical protein
MPVHYNGLCLILGTRRVFTLVSKDSDPYLAYVFEGLCLNRLATLLHLNVTISSLSLLPLVAELGRIQPQMLQQLQDFFCRWRSHSYPPVAVLKAAVFKVGT